MVANLKTGIKIDLKQYYHVREEVKYFKKF
jgi:hypothetical protein